MARTWTTRWLATLVVASLGVVVGGGAAHAGGAVFEFERRAYAPGDVAAGQTSFDAQDLGQSDLPILAHLQRREADGDPDNSVPSVFVGPVVVERFPGDPLARISFRVPDVRPGTYLVALCNRACETFRPFGELVGGWIDIAATAEEARLMNVVDDLHARLDEQLSVMASTVEGLAETRTTLATRAARDAERTAASLEGIERRLDAIEERVSDLGESPGGGAWSFVAVFAAGAAVGVAATWARRRPAIGPSRSPSPMPVEEAYVIEAPREDRMPVVAGR